MAQRINQDLNPHLRQDLFERLAQRNDQLFWGGVAMAVVGVLALLFPVVATVAVAVMVDGFSFLPVQRRSMGHSPWRAPAHSSANCSSAS
jgi:type III secretory pathway component EscV